MKQNSGTLCLIYLHLLSFNRLRSLFLDIVSSLPLVDEPTSFVSNDAALEFDSEWQISLESPSRSQCERRNAVLAQRSTPCEKSDSLSFFHPSRSPRHSVVGSDMLKARTTCHFKLR